MPYVRELLIGVEPWRQAGSSRRELGSAFEAALGRLGTVPPTLDYTPNGLLVQRLSVAGAIACLDVALRGDTWAVAVCLRAPSMPRRTVPPVLVRARRLPTGLAVRPDHRDGSVAATSAVLQLHAALVRARRPAAWRAIDALAVHGSRRQTAAALGCSVQAVSRQIRSSHLHATRATTGVVETLTAPH